MEPKYHTLFQAVIIVLAVMALPRRHYPEERTDEERIGYTPSQTQQAPSQDRMMASN